MVLFQDWERFALEAQSLHGSSGGRARLLLKYKHKDGILSVKVTNDVKTLSFKTNDKDDIRFVEKLQQWFLSEATDPSKLVGSAEHAASAGSGASASASGARSPAGVAQSDKRAAPHSTKRSTISGAQRRKAHRAALKAGTAQPSEAEQRRALRKAASRSRKRERRETKRMLAAAGSGPALPAMIPTTTSR